MKGISPAITDLALVSFSGRKENVTPFVEHHILSTEWNKGVEGNTLDGMDIMMC
jgi:hypothetical protein